MSYYIAHTVIKFGFKILNVNKNIKEEGTCIDQTDDNNVGYNYLFFDNVHLNHRFGVPLLKNWMLSHLLLSSNGRVDNNVPSKNKVQTHIQGRLIRYMAQMFGNTNIIQIMLQMPHRLSIATQLPVTTTTIDDTTEYKTVFTEA